MSRGKLTANEAFSEFMGDFGVVVDQSKLPGPDTPLPPTNATLHILDFEDGYGTLDRKFTALCGVSWCAKENTGEHKYFFRAETWWHKHVNCADCLTALAVVTP